MGPPMEPLVSPRLVGGAAPVSSAQLRRALSLSLSLTSKHKFTARTRASNSKPDYVLTLSSQLIRPCASSLPLSLSKIRTQALISGPSWLPLVCALESSGRHTHKFKELAASWQQSRRRQDAFAGLASERAPNRVGLAGAVDTTLFQIWLFRFRKALR